MSPDTRNLVAVKVDVENVAMMERDLASYVEGKLTSLKNISEFTNHAVVETLYCLNEFEKKNTIKSVIGSMAVQNIL
jgi:hypothetical protein